MESDMKFLGTNRNVLLVGTDKHACKESLISLLEHHSFCIPKADRLQGSEKFKRHSLQKFLDGLLRE